MLQRFGSSISDILQDIYDFMSRPTKRETPVYVESIFHPKD